MLRPAPHTISKFLVRLVQDRININKMCNKPVTLFSVRSNNKVYNVSFYGVNIIFAKPTSVN
jgi:hypothetical protein